MNKHMSNARSFDYSRIKDKVTHLTNQLGFNTYYPTARAGESGAGTTALRPI